MRTKAGTVKTYYKKLHGEQEGRVKVDFQDGEISGTLYADDYSSLYRATRFLTLRNLDKRGISLLLSDTHGEDQEEEGEDYEHLF